MIKRADTARRALVLGTIVGVGLVGAVDSAAASMPQQDLNATGTAASPQYQTYAASSTGSSPSHVALTLTQSSALGFTVKSVFSDDTSGATAASNTLTTNNADGNPNEVNLGFNQNGDVYTESFDYNTPGSYLVTDTVTDSNGATATASVEVSTLGSAYSAVTPTRILDTRNGTGAAKATVGTNSIVKLKVEGAGPVPSSGVTAVVLNLTAVVVSGGGFVTAYPSDDGTSVPGSSSLNYAAGQTVANLVTVPVGSDGYVYLADKGGTVNLIADVSGYYSISATDLYEPAAGPERVLDTRTGLGAAKGAIPNGGTVKVLVALGDGDLAPAGQMTAVAVNITVVNASNGGNIAAYADGASRPGTSNVNFGKGQIVANNAVVPVAADGKIDLTAEMGTTASVNLVMDVVGYYSASPNFASAAFVPIAPSRVFDSRKLATGQLKNGIEYDLNLGSWAQPTAAIEMNVTVTNTKSGGYLNVYTYGAPIPSTSNLNWNAGQTVANAAFPSANNANGWVSIYNASGGSTDVILDISGYFETSRV